MTARPGQFRLVFPDGLAVDRLPIGLAAGTLYVPFVVVGRDWMALAHDRSFSLARELRGRIQVSGDGVDLRYVGGSGGGDHVVQKQFDEFRGVGEAPIDEQLTAVRITYSFDGAVVAREAIDVDW